jgi:hypothetical protein
MSEYMTGRGIRTPQYTYAAAAERGPGWKPVPSSDRYHEYMLYDLYADPFQHVNLAGRVPYQKIAEELRGRLAERIAEASGRRAEVGGCLFPYS